MIKKTIILTTAFLLPACLAGGVFAQDLLTDELNQLVDCKIIGHHATGKLDVILEGKEGRCSVKLAGSFSGGEGNKYVRLEKKFAVPQNWSAATGMDFWFQNPKPFKGKWGVHLHETGGAIYSAYAGKHSDLESFSGWTRIRLPFKNFYLPVYSKDGNGKLDLDQIAQLDIVMETQAGDCSHHVLINNLKLSGANIRESVLWKDYAEYGKNHEKEALAGARKAARGSWQAGYYGGLTWCNGLPGPGNEIPGREIGHLLNSGAFDFAIGASRNLSPACHAWLNGQKQDPLVEMNNFFLLKKKVKIIMQLYWWGKMCGPEWVNLGAPRKFPDNACWVEIAESMGDLDFETMEAGYEKKAATELWALLLKTIDVQIDPVLAAAKKFDGDTHPLYAVCISEEEPILAFGCCANPLHKPQWMMESKANQELVTQACIKVHNLLYQHIYARYNRGAKDENILKVGSGIWIPERKWGCHVSTYKGLKYDFIFEDWYAPAGPVELDGLIETFDKAVKNGTWNMERDFFTMWGSSPFTGEKHEVQTRAWIATNFTRLRQAGFKNIVFFAMLIDDYAPTPLTTILQWISLKDRPPNPR
ncbi:MAG: hypothetical protein PHV34_12485 [Verrucomicrobiae bacterium]|nr:hypothetical protein [Verrucomicrobiae bacterium]